MEGSIGELSSRVLCLSLNSGWDFNGDSSQVAVRQYLVAT